MVRVEKQISQKIVHQVWEIKCIRIITNFYKKSDHGAIANALLYKNASIQNSFRLYILKSVIRK